MSEDHPLDFLMEILICKAKDSILALSFHVSHAQSLIDVQTICEVESEKSNSRFQKGLLDIIFLFFQRPQDSALNFISMKSTLLNHLGSANLIILKFEMDLLGFLQ